MKKIIYVNSLILLFTFSQGNRTLSEDNIEKSADLHVLKKRLIDNTPWINKQVMIENIPYVVNILRNGVPNCGGSILYPDIIITAGHCVIYNTTYTILSGSRYINRGNHHNVIRKIIYPRRPDVLTDDLALLIIFPPIDLHQNSINRKITLYNGHVPPHTLGTISGWGCSCIKRGKKVFPETLRSISVPIIIQETCRHAYQEYIEITDKEICTLDLCGRKCASGDSGNPLVVANKLVGVLAFLKDDPPGTPDVFMNLSYPEYRNWIVSNVPQILIE